MAWLALRHENEANSVFLRASSKSRSTQNITRGDITSYTLEACMRIYNLGFIFLFQFIRICVTTEAADVVEFHCNCAAVYAVQEIVQLSQSGFAILIHICVTHQALDVLHIHVQTKRTFPVLLSETKSEGVKFVLGRQISEAEWVDVCTFVSTMLES